MWERERNWKYNVREQEGKFEEVGMWDWNREEGRNDITDKAVSETET